jgi:hypothetical protein
MRQPEGHAYQDYLRSVLALPAFVGCHWFQYSDDEGGVCRDFGKGWAE